MKPMLCKPFTVVQFRNGMALMGDDYVLEEKFDGIRAYIENGKLYDRKGHDITHKFPEFYGIEHVQQAVFDGEVIADTGDFNDIAGRVHTKDKLAVKLLARQHPARFVCFDRIELGKHEMLSQRRLKLEQENFRIMLTWFDIAPQVPASQFESAWANVLAQEKEGLVVKRLSGTYQEGSRSGAWLKIKAWAEDVATFTKYEEHPRGITIETADGRRVVVNGSQASLVANGIDTQGKIEAEIQYLPQKNSDAWRFPSFRRLL